MMQGESVRSICKSEVLPVQATIYKWLAAQPEFAEQYARARAIQADVLAEEIIAIADDSSGDTYTDDEGVKRVDHEHVQRARLRVDARKWYVAKLAPKVYGDATTLKHTDASGERPPVFHISIDSPPTPEK